MALKLSRLRSQYPGLRKWPPFNYPPTCRKMPLANQVEPVRFSSMKNQSRITPHTGAG